MNPVLTTTGPLSRSVPMILRHHGGAVTETRGIMAVLSKSTGQAEATYAKAGRMAWLPLPTESAVPEFLEITDPDTATVFRYRIYRSQAIKGHEFGALSRQTLQLYLQDGVAQPAPEA